MRKERKVTVKVFGIEGEGKNKMEVKQEAEHRLEQADLGGDYYPRIYEWRGTVMLLYRHPVHGWEYRSVVTPQDGARTGPVNGNSLEGHDFKESERRVLRHLADLGWRREDGETVPEFITNEEDRERLASQHRWQAFTLEAQDHGITQSEARCYYADVMAGGLHWLRQLAPEVKAEVDAIITARTTPMQTCKERAA
jgi:hypothetical protein